MTTLINVAQKLKYTYALGDNKGMNRMWTVRCQPDTARKIKGLLEELIYSYDLEGAASLHQDKAGISRISVWWEGPKEKEFVLAIEKAREQTEMWAAESMGENLYLSDLL